MCPPVMGTRWASGMTETACSPMGGKPKGSLCPQTNKVGCSTHASSCSVRGMRAPRRRMAASRRLRVAGQYGSRLSQASRRARYSGGATSAACSSPNCRSSSRPSEVGSILISTLFSPRIESSRMGSGAEVSRIKAGHAICAIRVTRSGRSSASQNVHNPPMELAITGIESMPSASMTEPRKATATLRSSPR